VRIEKNSDEPPWKAEFDKWSKPDRKQKAERTHGRSNTESHNKPTKKRKKIKRESLSSLSTIEHVHLGVIAIDLTVSSDDDSEEMEIPELMQMPREIPIIDLHGISVNAPYPDDQVHAVFDAGYPTLAPPAKVVPEVQQYPLWDPDST
jgi:hypothetical protein